MIEEFLTKLQLPSYRTGQFYQAYYQQLIADFDELTSWSKDLRNLLKAEIPFSTLTVKKQLISADRGTEKVLFTRDKDGQLIETVLMKHEDGRNTICVSCMVGCPVNCSFCATGKLGFNGNLDASEIVDQVLHFARELKKADLKVTNVVFMGMGEPMLNLDQVMGAIDILSDEAKFGLSKRRITVSTSGYVTQLRKLIKSGFKGRLAISLHAPNQALRQQLMPVAKVFALDDLMTVLDEYVKLTNKRISYEYILIQDVTDKPEHAAQLGKLFKHRLAHVNLIPYNPIKGVPYERSSKKNIFRFKELLKNYGVQASVRVTMGDDIKAACGQLAGEAC